MPAVITPKPRETKTPRVVKIQSVGKKNVTGNSNTATRLISKNIAVSRLFFFTTCPMAMISTP